MKWAHQTDRPQSAHRTLTPSRFATIVLLLGAALPAFAQERLTVDILDQRLQRIERVLDQALIGLMRRIDDQQQEMRELRGEIESLNHQLDTLKRRNRDLYADTDSRLSELENTLAGDNPLGDIDTLDADELPAGDGDTRSPSNVSEAGDAEEAEDAAAVIVPGGASGATADADAAGGGTAAREIRRTATAAEQQAYTEAYDLLASGDNEAAVSAFEKFIEAYPDGPYTDNAWYWLGEGLYAQRSFEAALDSFTQVVEAFPSSPKVPDARLKIGFTLYEQRQFGDARSILIGVQNDYPNRSASVLARKRLQQMDRDGL